MLKILRAHDFMVLREHASARQTQGLDADIVLDLYVALPQSKKKLIACVGEQLCITDSRNAEVLPYETRLSSSFDWFMNLKVAPLIDPWF